MKIISLGLSLVLALGSATNVYAQASHHLVPLTELHAALESRTAEREANIAEIRSLLLQDAVQGQLGGLFDLNQVETLVATLDEETLSHLGDRSRQINADIAAAGSTKWIIIGGVAAAAVIITIMLVIRLVINE